MLAPGADAYRKPFVPCGGRCPLAHDGVGDPIEEVLQRRFRHPRQERSIDHPADHSERRDVPGAHRELGSVGSQRGDLDISVESGEEAGMT
jgi:hypothetical protein